MHPLDLSLLNDFQRDFPLEARPFAHLADQLGCSEADVLQRLQSLHQAGSISRIGPVFRPNSIGVSTLAALAVPPERLDEVADWVSGFAQVNHNYQREHRYNLWFVATADEAGRLADTLAHIRSRSGCAMLDLPLVKDYYIDLGFDLHGRTAAREPAPAAISIRPDCAQRSLIRLLQGGVPLVAEPFRELADRLGTRQQVLLQQISDWQQAGIIKRFGVIVRHHELGYTANAMVVWDIDDADIDRVGSALAHANGVSLCYQRPRRLPEWRYNLFCMIHGKDRATVETRIRQLAIEHGLHDLPRQTLFSVKRYKQCGARYVLDRAA